MATTNRNQDPVGIGLTESMRDIGGSAGISLDDRLTKSSYLGVELVLVATECMNGRSRCLFGELLDTSKTSGAGRAEDQDGVLLLVVGNSDEGHVCCLYVVAL